MRKTTYGSTRPCPTHLSNCPNCGGKGYQVWTGSQWATPDDAQLDMRRKMTRMPHRANRPTMSMRDLRCLMAEPRHPGCAVMLAEAEQS